MRTLTFWMGAIIWRQRISITSSSSLKKHCAEQIQLCSTVRWKKQKKLAILVNINQLFGIEPDATAKLAIATITAARTAKAENVTLGIVKTYQTKAVKLKRVLIEHSTVEFADVWPNVHEIVKTLVTNCTFSAAKAG